jgi:DNA-binding transcriptional LysR family regulator
MVNLAQIDTNLLVVLHTVLREKSATRAAAKLHVTQSAVSNALARLRHLFGDALVIRGAGGLVATPRALSLAPKLERALDELASLLGPPQAFDPLTATRTFTIACIDVVAIAVLPTLGAFFRSQLPRSKLRVVPLDRVFIENGLVTGEVDVLVGMPPSLPPGCSIETLYEDEMVCLVGDKSGFTTKRLTLAAYAGLRHLDISLFGEVSGGSNVDKALARVRMKRDVMMEVPYLAAAPLIAAQTDLVATLPKRLAMAFVEVLPLRMLPVPLALPRLKLQQVWHARSADDAAVNFLRQLVRSSLVDTSRLAKSTSEAASRVSLKGKRSNAEDPARRRSGRTGGA